MTITKRAGVTTSFKEVIRLDYHSYERPTYPESEKRSNETLIELLPSIHNAAQVKQSILCEPSPRGAVVLCK